MNFNAYLLTKLPCGLHLTRRLLLSAIVVLLTGGYCASVVASSIESLQSFPSLSRSFEPRHAVDSRAEAVSPQLSSDFSNLNSESSDISMLGAEDDQALTKFLAKKTSLQLDKIEKYQPSKKADKLQPDNTFTHTRGEYNADVVFLDQGDDSIRQQETTEEEFARQNYDSPRHNTIMLYVDCMKKAKAQRQLALAKQTFETFLESQKIQSVTVSSDKGIHELFDEYLDILLQEQNMQQAKLIFERYFKAYLCASLTNSSLDLSAFNFALSYVAYTVMIEQLNPNSPMTIMFNKNDNCIKTAIMPMISQPKDDYKIIILTNPAERYTMRIKKQYAMMVAPESVVVVHRPKIHKICKAFSGLPAEQLKNSRRIVTKVPPRSLEKIE